MRIAMNVALLALGLIANAAVAQDSAAARLKLLFDDAWEFTLAEDPVFATRFGDHRWDDKLAPDSLADQQRRLEERRKFRTRWQAIDRSQLQRSDQINYDLFGQLLNDDIAEGEFEMYLQPITNRSGFHISLPELPNDVPLNTLRDYEN